MTRKEFHDLVASAHAEYFPKASAANRDNFISTLMDDLEGSDIELENDEEVEEEDLDFED